MTRIGAMASTTHSRATRSALAAFLRNQRPVAVDELAMLIGWTQAEVRRLAKHQRVLRPDDHVRWQDAARWLLEAWPLEALLTTLGPDADLLPVGLQLLPLDVALPAYVLHGLRAQWQIEPMPHRLVRPASFADYLTDLLHRLIDPATVAALQHDVEFMRAYDFPEKSDDE